MPYKSPWPLLDIPKCNVLSWLYPPGKKVSTDPLWIDATDPSLNLSPAQMLEWIKRLAVGLDKLGLEKGEALMVFTPNHIYVPLAYLCAAGSGRFFSGANPTYTATEVAYQMKNLQAKIVLIHPALLQTGIAAAKEAGIPRDRLFQFTDTECKTVDGVRDWRAIAASVEESRDWQWPNLDGEKALTTVACVNYSSGTTGLPKGVCISHRNLIANSEQTIFNRWQGTGNTPEKFEPERWLCFLPLYHAYSQLFTVNIALRLGITAYVMRSFVFEDFLKYIQKYKITHLQTVPPIIVLLAKRPETSKYDLSSVQNIICGAAPLSRELQNEVSSRFKLAIVQGWGMTETTCAALGIPGFQNELTGSVGHLIPNTEAMLVDDDGKEISKDGEPGEILLKGPQMLIGYWRNEAATKECRTADGWFKTGDVAVCRDNKFWIVDRKKELIKVKGLQVAPAELEAALLENDDVADAAVAGVTVHDEEHPRAYVVLQPDKKGKISEKDIQKWIEPRVARHKRLTGGVKFIDEVPKLPSGKIMRKIMREWAKRDAKELEGDVRPRL